MSDIDKKYLELRFKDYFDIDSRYNLVGYDFEDIDNLYEFINELLEEKNLIISQLKEINLSLERRCITLIETIDILKETIS